MIFGIGSDLVDVRRIERTDRAPWRALPRRASSPIPSAPRPSGAPSGPRPMPSASPPRRPAPRRLGTGFRAGVFFRDMGVVNLPSGRPTMAAHRRRAGAARGHHAARATRPGSTSPSPMKDRWRRRSWSSAPSRARRADARDPGPSAALIARRIARRSARGPAAARSALAACKTPAGAREPSAKRYRQCRQAVETMIETLPRHFCMKCRRFHCALPAQRLEERAGPASGTSTRGR